MGSTTMTQSAASGQTSSTKAKSSTTASKKDYLGKLSPELILNVLECLPATDAVCFALTNKRNYKTTKNYTSNIRQLARRSDPDATDELLYRLEADVPRTSYCTVSNKLAPFTKYNPARPHRLHHHDGKRQRSDIHFGNSLFRLPFCAARLVMNQLDNPRRSLPASALAFTHERATPVPGVFWKESWEAKLDRAEGELLISSTHTFYHKHGNPDRLRSYFARHNMALCHHLSVGKRARTYKNVPLHISMIGHSTSNKTGRCAECETDWDLIIERPLTKRGSIVTIKTYHCLGPCTSPSDPQWQAMTMKYLPWEDDQ